MNVIRKHIPEASKSNVLGVVMLIPAILFVVASVIYFGAIIHAHIIALPSVYNRGLPSPMWQYYAAAPLTMVAGYYFTGLFAYFWESG